MAESSTIGILRVLLTADSTGFNAALAKAADQAEGWSQGLTSIGNRATQIGTVLTGLTVPIMAVGTGLVALATQSAAAGDSIAKAAREAGLSGQAYQELSFAVGQVAKVSEEQLTRAFGRLTNVIGEAANGNKRATESLKELGFTQAEIASGAITTEAAFGRFVTKMQEAPTAANAVALAGDLVGEKIGPKLAGALRESGDQVGVLRQQFVDLGLGMSGEALAASERWNDQVDTLSRQFAALGRELGQAFLPVLTDSVIPFIQNSVIPALKIFAEGLGVVLKAFTALPGPIQAVIGVVGGLFVALGPLLIAFGQLAVIIAPFIPQLIALGSTILTLATGPIGILAAALVALTAVWIKWGDDITRVVKDTFNAVKNWLVTQWEGSIFQAIARMLQAMGELYVALQVRIAAEVLKIYTAVKEWLVDKLTPLFTTIRNFLEPVVTMWTAAKDKVVGIVTALYTGVKTWLVDRFTEIVNSIKSKIDAVTNFFKQMKDAVVGNSFVPEMVDGIETHFGRLDNVMVRPTQTATSNTQSLFSGMSTGVQGIVDNLFNAVQGKTTNWSSSFQSIIHSVSGSTQNIFGALSSSVQQIVGGMFNSLLGQATNWGGMFMGILTNIIGAGINSLVSWALGKLGSLIGGWIGGGEEGTQVNPARDQFLAQFGGAGTGEGSGFWNLGARLEGVVGSAQAEQLHAALRSADTMSEFNAAVAAINQALGGGGFSGGFSGGGIHNTSGMSVEMPEEVMGVEERMRLAQMAEGGFGRVNRPTLFLAGEAGPEDFAFSGANKSMPGGNVTVQFNGPVFAEEEYIQTTVVDNILQALRMNRNSALTRLQSVAEIG